MTFLKPVTHSTYMCPLQRNGMFRLTFASVLVRGSLRQPVESGPFLIEPRCALVQPGHLLSLSACICMLQLGHAAPLRLCERCTAQLNTLHAAYMLVAALRSGDALPARLFITPACCCSGGL